MAVERTLSIIKPDAVAKNVIGDIYSRFEKGGLRVIAARMKHLTQKQAEGFYAVHAERPFFKDLVKFMTSGPVMVSVLEGPNAVAKHREIMGATDPAKAANRKNHLTPGDQILQDLAEETGGRAFFPYHVDDLDQSFQRR